ncbi:3-oxoacid CoA-transferase subunit B [uncultured Porphyromonas sp.]|jgi:3-oxoacid coA-transferase, B subunit|uniref:3-oxoacid CoA-transferase subunit B n=1 Tax=uncultured Porphyromonas sp. TaxID=159274 RepID=UPI002602C3C0|nr:3-oxoacid CoA-transferase subunit B [uncultured Porphyromonas sp.]
MDKNEIRETIARRVALELKDGDVVNLGIGLPTMVPNYLKADVEVMLQSENGMIGMGPAAKEGEEAEEWTNAGGGFITPVPGAASFDSATSFGIIRGGHVDVSILGALEVDENGDLANWIIPGKKAPGMGGAMDLLVGTRKVILAMEHTAKGTPKILKKCRLPLTAQGQVDLIITEMCVIEVRKGEGLVVTELNEHFTREEVIAATEASIIFAEDLRPMRQ